MAIDVLSSRFMAYEAIWRLSAGLDATAEVSMAKAWVGEAGRRVCALGHQVHGAIGFTQEHVLHRFTLRMLAWRDDFGNESHWAAELGRRVAARGADDFWPLVASR